MRPVRRAPAYALLVAGCALAAAAAGSGPYLTRTREVDVQRLLEAAARRQALRPVRLGERSPVSTTLDAVLMVLIGLGLLYGVYLFGRLLWGLRTLRLRRGREGRPTAEYDPGEESRDDAETELRRRVVDELAALSADLDALPDAREAVIACYVRMERAFAEAGAGRAPTESPMELLARVLDQLAVPEADVRRLTELFGEARFSAHPVTEEMRTAARRALAGVSDALAVRA